MPATAASGSFGISTMSSPAASPRQAASAGPYASSTGAITNESETATP